LDLRLTDKVVLVTGSTAGIGLAIARSLATEGAHVYVNGRTQERVEAAVAAIWSQAATIKVDGIVADFSSLAGADAVMAKQQNKSKQVIEKEFFEHVRPSSLLKRFATVDEVAALVTYIASELSSATNGAALRVDGGVVKAIL
jgi:NAD(P)-dependent dehydrogenase (short-subunit alcohol dehydrogenase family)